MQQVNYYRQMYRKYTQADLIDSLELYQIQQQSDSSTELDKDSVKQINRVQSKRQIVKKKINVILQERKSKIQKDTVKYYRYEQQQYKQEASPVKVQSTKISILQALVANINSINQKQEQKQNNISQVNSPLPFPSQLIHPEIQNNKYGIYEGGIGHYTYFLKRPIIEGNYYIEFKILETLKFSFNQQKTNQEVPLKGQPSIRIGFCPRSADENTYMHKCLGVSESIGIHLQKGHLISQNKRNKIFDSKFGEMDVAGLLYHCQSPSKNRQINKIHTKNYFILYKNNEQIFKGTNILKEDIYSFGFSLYNFARVQIRISSLTQQYMPKIQGQTVKAYEQCLYESIIYPDLKQYCILQQLDKRQKNAKESNNTQSPST